MEYLEDYLRKYMHGADVFVMWLDNDRAGESICFQLLKLIAKHKVNCSTENVFRANFSSLAPRDISSTFDNLCMMPDDLKAKAEELKQEFDLRLGLSFTMHLSSSLHKEFEKLKKIQKRVSYGPCQFPAFWFCQKRAKEIEDFKSEEYWKAVVAVQYDGDNIIDLCHEAHFTTKEEAQEVISDVLKATSLKVVEVKKVRKVVKKPLPMNTVDLLREASSRFNFNATKTMRIAKTLYSRGFISYPRTESRKYSENFEFEEVLKYLRSIDCYKEKAQERLAKSHPLLLDEDEYQEHPPLTPLVTTDVH